jgi:hypothetical protein
MEKQTKLRISTKYKNNKPRSYSGLKNTIKSMLKSRSDTITKRNSKLQNWKCPE